MTVSVSTKRSRKPKPTPDETSATEPALFQEPEESAYSFGASDEKDSGATAEPGEVAEVADPAAAEDEFTPQWQDSEPMEESEWAGDTSPPEDTLRSASDEDYQADDEMIRDAERDVIEATMAVKRLAGDLKIAKSALKDCVDRLEGMRDENLPLFDATRAGVKPPSDLDSDNWREVTIEDVGITPGICKLLREENGVETLGDLANYADGNNGDFSGMEKIGRTKHEKIVDAIEKFWARGSES